MDEIHVSEMIHAIVNNIEKFGQMIRFHNMINWHSWVNMTIVEVCLT
jgi:hypothetical protein